MEEFWARDILEILESFCEPDDIMTIHWSEIAKMQRFKEIAIFHKDSLQSLLSVFEEFFGISPEFTSFIKEISDFITNKIECVRCRNFRQIITKSSYIWIDAHVVIIEYHEDIGI